MKRDTVMLEYCWVNLSHDHEEEPEKDNIPPSLPTPNLGNHYFSLFDDIIDSTPCNIHHNRSLLIVEKIDNIPAKCNTAYLRVS